MQACRQEFPEGGSSTRTASRAPHGARCYCDRSPGVFGAKSCNLATSRHFILTFGKSGFSNLIFKDFHLILDLNSAYLFSEGGVVLATGMQCMVKSINQC